MRFSHLILIGYGQMSSHSLSTQVNYIAQLHNFLIGKKQEEIS